jgi:hypothetical protein
MEQPVFTTDEGRNWLISHLKFGPVDVTFTKKDGTLRTMKCTLKEELMLPYEKKTDKVKEVSLEVLPVYDLDKESWRSFRLDSITQVEFSIGE